MTPDATARRRAGLPLALFGMLASLVLLSSVGYLAYRATLERMASARLLEHSYAVIGALEDLLFRIAEAEATWLARAGSEGAKHGWEQAAQAVGAQQDRLRALTDDDATQKAQLARLDALVRDRMAQLAATRDVELGHDPEPHEALVAQGRTLMAPVREQVQAMIRAEQRLLSERERVTAEAARASLTALTSGFGLGGVLIVLAFAALWRENVQRAEAETASQELAARNARAELRVRKLLDSTPDAVVVVRADGTIDFVNDHTSVLFGYARDELVGQALELLVPERFRGSHAGHRAAYRTHPVVRPMGKAGVTLYGRRKDGSEFPASISLSPIEMEDATYAIAAVRDVTDQQRAAEALARAKQKAEDANRELESFSYSVAHDLRAPLRAIDGFSKALLEDCGDELDAGGQEYLGYVVKSANHMAELIDDLLSLSRVSRTELTRQPIDLSALVTQLMERVARDRGERKLELVVAPGLSVLADPRLTAIALENLLSNAWKFTRDREVARIEFGRIDGEEPTFYVRDNGAGFDMAYSSKLFGAFQRLHREAEFEGTGIGLATVQRIIHRHGGRIWAEGQLGRGATFTFTIGTGEAA